MKTLNLLILILTVNLLFSNSMAITSLRQLTIQGESLKIVETLPERDSYYRYRATYLSEGLKIYGLLTVPKGLKPEKGYPSILFIHGYIPPKEYSTTGSYPVYQDRVAREEFITFKPDLRGHRNSEGEPVRAHISEKYVVDTLYALEALEKYNDTDPDNIFYWGHSNGGEIGLRVVTITDKLRGASFWAGVVGSYMDMLETYNYKIPFLRNAKDKLILENKLPSENPEFWDSIDPYSYLKDITTPIIIHHGTLDKSVPIELSKHLYDGLKDINKRVIYYEYEGDNHNISQNYGVAFTRDLQFFRSLIR